MRDLPKVVKGATVGLKACPFCGKMARLMSEGEGFRTAWFVECGYCGCNSPTMIRQKTTIFRWNRRKQTPADALTVNGVVYGLDPATAAGLRSCHQNLKRKKEAS